jgi:hypothetical protein
VTVTVRRSEVVLLTELYPPVVGGSAVLFESLYTRLGDGFAVHVSPRSAEGADSTSGGPK